MANKLLLIDDVESLGRSGDIVSVKPGYARNFLLPQGLAMIADKNTIRMQAKLQEERKQRAIKDLDEYNALAARFEEIVLTITVKVDHEGHMYGSVSAGDIADLLQDQAKVEIEKRSIQLKHPIKTTGDHKISLKLKEGVVASVTLQVSPEETAQAAQKADK